MIRPTPPSHGPVSDFFSRYVSSFLERTLLIWFQIAVEDFKSYGFVLETMSQHSGAHLSLCACRGATSAIFGHARRGLSTRRCEGAQAGLGAAVRPCSNVSRGRADILLQATASSYPTPSSEHAANLSERVWKSAFLGTSDLEKSFSAVITAQSDANRCFQLASVQGLSDTSLYRRRADVYSTS